MQGLRFSAKQVAALEAKFQMLEGDDDGKVSKVQLQAFLQKEGAFEIFDTTEVTEVMARFDKNGTGHLEPDEMKKVSPWFPAPKTSHKDKLGQPLVPSSCSLLFRTRRC